MKTIKKIGLCLVALGLLLTFAACGGSNSVSEENTQASTTGDIAPTPEPTPDAGPTPSPDSANVVDNADSTSPSQDVPGDTVSVFSPQDVSDATINSIQTYDDYLLMYKKITEDYIANYEAVVKDTLLYSEEAFATMKQQYDAAFESQKTMYGSMGNTDLIGKDELVEFLISYRDGLKEVTDAMEETLKAF